MEQTFVAWAEIARLRAVEDRVWVALGGLASAKASHASVLLSASARLRALCTQ